MADIPFVKLVGRLTLTIGDTDDPDIDPDVIPCDEGIVRFIPVNTFVKVVDGTPVPFTAGNTAIDVPLDTDGYLSWQDARWVPMLDFTSPSVNPTIAAGSATHEVQFRNVKAQGTSVPFPTTKVRLAADSLTTVNAAQAAAYGLTEGDLVCDLAKLTPVPTAGSTPIVRGEQGVGIESLDVAGDALTYTLTDGSTGQTTALPTALVDSAEFIASQIPAPGPVNDALNGAYGALAVLEGTPCVIEGDSYTQDTSGGDFTTNFAQRIAARWRTQTAVNRGVSGKRCDQVLMQQAIPNVTGNNPGLVLLPDVMLNDVDTANAGMCPPSDTAEALRALLAYHTARYIGGPADLGLFYGPNWTNGTTSTATSYVDITVSTASLWLVLGFGSTAGALRVFAPDGTTLATVNVGGYVNTFNGVVKITVPGSGNRSVRVVVDSGTVSVLGYLVPSAAPTSLVWVKPGRVVDSARTTRLAATAAACAPVAALFPSVLPVDVDSAYDYTTMLTSDGVHPNPLGKAYYADLIDRTARSTAAATWRADLNGKDAAYTPIAASYTNSTATMPSAPAAAPTVTAAMQLKVTLTPPTDGGSTVTGYDIQTSTDGTTWTTAASGLAARSTSYTIASGLTVGTNYQVRYRATNAIGAGAWSPASAAVAAGAVPTVFVDDNFTRADNATSLGSVPSGSLSGTAYATTPTATLAGIQSNKAAWTTAGQSESTIDVGIANAHVTATVGFVGTTTTVGGVSLSMGSATVGGYVAYRDGDGYVKLKKRGTNYAAYTALGQSAATYTASVGDVIELSKNGSTITVRYNGATVVTYTDASPLTGTKAGLYAIAGLPSFSHLTIDNNV